MSPAACVLWCDCVAKWAAGRRRRSLKGQMNGLAWLARPAGHNITVLAYEHDDLKPVGECALRDVVAQSLPYQGWNTVRYNRTEFSHRDMVLANIYGNCVQFILYNIYICG